MIVPAGSAQFHADPQVDPKTLQEDGMAIILTEHDDGGRIQTRVGDTLEVRLPEIASSGYRWSPDDVDSRLFELNDSGIDSPGEGIGASGQAYFRITVHAAGSGTLRLKYWRPWEGEAAVQRRFAVDVTATAA